jgi:hypothetical protein
MSAAAFSVLASLDRRTAILLACLSVLALVGGVIAIRHASNLVRDDRPPFIDFGLASLAITLVSAHPLILAIRRRRLLHEAWA